MPNTRAWGAFYEHLRVCEAEDAGPDMESGRDTRRRVETSARSHQKPMKRNRHEWNAVCDEKGNQIETFIHCDFVGQLCECGKSTNEAISHEASTKWARNIYDE